MDQQAEKQLKLLQIYSAVDIAINKKALVLQGISQLYKLAISVPATSSCSLLASSRTPRHSASRQGCSFLTMSPARGLQRLAADHTHASVISLPLQHEVERYPAAALLERNDSISQRPVS
ncbi:hypothetical protein T4C_6754 [Trichinella pseudospiralis]|uniref:Uncharacterized protein n=1 Tax=Trichinella pseudospiralis TaxID=6337 RepID=A0A0V1IQ95_TRIPS|nr:hypothetical protein T4C_6754 [Trichinella pseudospiralis]